MDIEEIKQRTLEIYDLMHEADKAYIELWKKHVLFTWRWWAILAATVVPWLIYIITRKKDSVHRLFYVYFFVALAATELDILGINFGLWAYPISILPLMPCFIPFDLTVLPVTTMLFIQFSPKTKTIYKA